MNRKLSSARQGALWGGVGALSCAAIAMAAGKGQTSEPVTPQPTKKTPARDPLTAAIPSGLSEEGGIAGSPSVYATCFELPDYVIGPLAGQQGWTDFAANPGGGQVVAAALEGAQALGINNGAGASTTNTGPRSPVQTGSVERWVADGRIMIPALGGPIINYLTQTPVQALVTFRLQFEGDGDILVLDDLDGSGPGASAFIDSGADWTPGTTHTFRVVSHPAIGKIDCYKDGVPFYRCNTIFGSMSQQGLFFRLNVAGDPGARFDCFSNTPLNNGCVSDIVPDNATNIDDLLAVISGWGPCPPPPVPGSQSVCISNIDNAGASANNTNIDDLLDVISGWGPCPTPTGACCNPAGGCVSIQTSYDCTIAGGNYLGDNTLCANCPSIPPNDECSTAAAIAVGATTTVNNTLANTSAEPPGPGCQPLSKDVWYAMPTVPGTSYTVDTTLTATPSMDTVLEAYAITGGDCATLSILNCVDDTPPFGTLTVMTFAASSDTTIIRLASWSTSAGGNITLRTATP